jgi:hypothetical protein
MLLAALVVMLVEPESAGLAGLAAPGAACGLPSCCC